MKIKQLNESKEVVLKQHLTEDVDQVRARVREFLEERLDAATDNIAIELASEVEGYNPDWCYAEFYGNFIDQLEKARLLFLNKLESLLFAEAPMNEALKETVDMSAMKYAVVKPNGEYAGVPCESVDEARELAAQEEGRVVFKLSKVLFGESYDKDGNSEKCEKCGTLLNDMGTCPKCDEGEEDYGDDPKLELDESLFPDTKLILNEDAVSKQTSYTMANRIATLAKKELNLSDYEAETLESDINNLRSDEWVDTFATLPDDSISKSLFFTYAVETVPDAVKEIIRGIVEEMFECGHPDPEAWSDVLMDLDGFDFDEEEAHSYFLDCLSRGPKGLNEALLTEGPMGPALRRLGRSIANKIDPKGATKREIKGHEKDDKAQHEKHAHPVLARDFTSKAQAWKFYPNVRNPKPMNFDQWWDRYKDVATKAKLTDDEKKLYAEWYNACVVTEDDFYVRRGSENLLRKYVQYLPGKNDEVLKMYRVEPYQWYKRDFDPTPEDPDPTPEDPDPIPEDPDPTPEDPKEKKKKKKKKPVGAPELDRFRKLCRLTSFRIYDKKTKQQLTYDDICKITVETIPSFYVNTNYDHKSSLDVWFQKAIESKFLYKLPEYIERFCKPLLTEDTLMEAPVVKLDGVDLMNPDKVDFKDLIKRATDKEQAELRDKANRDAIDELKNKYKNVAGIVSQYQHDSPEEALNVLFNILVPDSGKADSVAGELVRAIVRLISRSNNDGDMFYTGYGLETCGSSAMYLYNHGFDTEIDEMIERAPMLDDDRYDDMLLKLASNVISRIVENPELITTPNNEDSRNGDYSYIKDMQPTFEFEFYGSDDINALVDAEILNSWKLKEYVEHNLEWEPVFKGAEVDRPWTHYDHSVTVSGLTRDALERAEDLLRDVDSFWQDLVDEYSDELESIKEGDEEDLDESLMSSDFQLLHGDEIIEGMNGNLSDKEIDKQIRHLTKISKQLGLSRVEDLVAYCDTEWMYDPTAFDNTFFTLPESPAKFNVENVDLMAAKEFGNIWLYFRNENDAITYLNYCNSAN